MGLSFESYAFIFGIVSIKPGTQACWQVLQHWAISSKRSLKELRFWSVFVLLIYTWSRVSVWNPSLPTPDRVSLCSPVLRLALLTRLVLNSEIKGMCHQTWLVWNFRSMQTYKSYGASEMAKQVPNGLSKTAGTHTVYHNQLLKFFLWSPHNTGPHHDKQIF